MCIDLHRLISTPLTQPPLLQGDGLRRLFRNTIEKEAEIFGCTSKMSRFSEIAAISSGLAVGPFRGLFSNQNKTKTDWLRQIG